MSDDSEEESRPCPAQEQIKKEICVLESKINTAVLARDSGLADAGMQSKIMKLRSDLELKKKDLRKKVNKARLAKKYRSERQATIKALIERDPEAAKALKVSSLADKGSHLTNSIFF